MIISNNNNFIKVIQQVQNQQHKNIVCDLFRYLVNDVIESYKEKCVSVSHDHYINSSWNIWNILSYRRFYKLF